MKALVFNNYREQFDKFNESLKLEVVDFEVIKFKNGEGKILVNDSVKGEDVIIFSDFNNITYYSYKGKKREYSKDEYYVELKRLISALDLAKSISVFLPLMYECRQNSNNEGESKDYEMFVKDLKAMGVKNIITFENHGTHKNVKSYSLAKLFSESEYDVVVSPDKGGKNRAKEYSEILKCDLYHFDKKRDLTHLEDGSNPISEYGGESYDFTNKRVLIVDDILDSGKTIIKALENINRAKNIDVFVAYPLFSKGLKLFKKACKNKSFNKIYISNLINVDKKVLKSKFVEVVDTSSLVGEVVR